MSCDILVFAPHPDDAEIQCGASIARHCRLGAKVVIIDATGGEMGSLGSREERQSESEAASAILGISGRANLELPDGHLDEHSPEARRRVVVAIRRHRPRQIWCIHPHTRHGDHRALANLVISCAKTAELHRWDAEGLPAHRGARLLAYEGELPITPQLLVACEEEDWQRKRKAICCYHSQLSRKPGDPATSIAEPGFLGWVEARGRVWGHQAGSPFAEAFCAPLQAPAIADLRHLHIPSLSHG